MKLKFKNYNDKIKFLFAISLRKKQTYIGLSIFFLVVSFLLWTKDCYLHHYFGKQVLSKTGLFDMDLKSSCPLMKVAEIRGIAADYGSLASAKNCPKLLRFKEIDEIEENFKSMKEDDKCYYRVRSLTSVFNEGWQKKYDFDIELYEKNGDLVIGILSRGYIPLFTFDDFKYVFNAGPLSEYPYLKPEIYKCMASMKDCRINYKGKYKEELPKKPHKK